MVQSNNSYILRGYSWKLFLGFTSREEPVTLLSFFQVSAPIMKLYKNMEWF